MRWVVHSGQSRSLIIMFPTSWSNKKTKNRYLLCFTFTHLVTHLVLAGIPPGGLGLSELVHEKPILVCRSLSSFLLNALMLVASTASWSNSFHLFIARLEKNVFYCLACTWLNTANEIGAHIRRLSIRNNWLNCTCMARQVFKIIHGYYCLLYTSPSPRD